MKNLKINFLTGYELEELDCNNSKYEKLIQAVFDNKEIQQKLIKIGLKHNDIDDVKELFEDYQLEEKINFDVNYEAFKKPYNTVVLKLIFRFEIFDYEFEIVENKILEGFSDDWQDKSYEEQNEFVDDLFVDTFTGDYPKLTKPFDLILSEKLDLILKTF